MEATDFKTALKTHNTNVKLALLSGIGVIGGITTMSINFTLVAIYLTLAFIRSSQVTYKNIGICEEYQKFNAIYEFIMNELIENSKELSIESIEEIYAYFTFLMNNNYLSYDQDMSVLIDQIIHCESAIQNALALNKHGLCRNINPMLSDFLNKKGYETVEVGCDYYRKKTILPEYAKNIEASFEDIEKSLKVIGNQKAELTIAAYKEKFKNKTRFKGNHVIIKAKDDKHTYYLDTSIPQIYMPIPGREGEYISSSSNFIVTRKPKKKKSPFKQDLFDEYLEEKEVKDIFEVIYNLDQIEQRINENIDIIDNMYRHIQPALKESEDIYQKILIPK